MLYAKDTSESRMTVLAFKSLQSATPSDILIIFNKGGGRIHSEILTCGPYILKVSFVLF